MTDAEARTFLIDYFTGTNAKLAKAAGEKIHARHVEYEIRRLDTQAEKLIAENPVPPPNKGPSPDQIRSYITEVLDPQLGISPPPT